MKIQYFRKNLLPGSLRRHAGFWRDIRDPMDLSALLHIPDYHLQLLSAKPAYREYKIPKKDGSFRLIEDPKPDLKKALRKINHFLQAAYYFRRPQSVHGFCISPKHQERRNILSNASRHIGNPYMVNLDMEDFFHTVSLNHVDEIWKQQFPGFRKNLSRLLTRITTRNGRLPMGAPTSPALSNYACLKLDADLESLTAYSGLTYTRFADDLTFSAQNPILETDLKMVRDIIAESNFLVNEEKVKKFGPSDSKTVTGLIVTPQGVKLPEPYLPQIKEEIARLRSVMLVEQRYQTGMSMRKLKLLKQELQGKINFAGMVLGTSHEEIIQLEEQYDTAIYAPKEYESANWLEIPYDTF